ncbi:unnamed protein product [Paramecium sonneborni]|uniref:Protein kinase domain-containing protein n=1 Tax=Paramecium sonneborni TaxID=65129 RepID=A0A8S1MPY0_9CILI|nr:unnamed protein product [Paramecium sonneborni]
MYQDNQTIDLPTYQGPNRQYIIVKELGKGAEGIIYEAKPKNQQENNQNVAIKKYNDLKHNEEQFIDWLIQNQQQHQFNNLIRIFEMINYNQNKYLIMELGQSNLDNYLQENQDLNQSEKLKICLEISKAIQFLHQNDYIIRDIKPQNFVKVNNQFKLIDFGKIKNSNQDKLQTYNPGTIQYQAPEANIEKYSKPIDIFSLGCVFYEVFQGEQLFQGKNEKEVKKIKQNYISDQSNLILKRIDSIQLKEIKDLIIQMLNNNQQNRPDINKIVDTLIQIQLLPQKIQQEESQKNERISNTQQLNKQNVLNYYQLVNNLLEIPTKEFPQRQFHLLQLLGDGGEGGVYKAKPFNETFYQKDIAIKIQSKIKDNELSFIDFLIDYQKNQEKTQFMKSNLITIYERFEFQGNQGIIMELGTKDLYSVLQNKQKLSVQQKESIIQQISQSISFLHKQGMIHRDIKPENFIQSGNIFKLIDFGLIKKREENLRNKLNVGTPLYQAPEMIFENGQNTNSVDVWFLGCLFYEIFQESPLFDGKTKDQVSEKIKIYCQDQKEVHNKINQLQIRQELKDIIIKMINPDHTKRPNMEQVQNQVSQKFNELGKLKPQNSFPIITVENTTNKINQFQQPVFQAQSKQFDFQNHQQPTIAPVENLQKKQKLQQISEQLTKIIKEYVDLEFENQNKQALLQQLEQHIDHIKNQTLKTLETCINQLKEQLLKTNNSSSLTQNYNLQIQQKFSKTQNPIFRVQQQTQQGLQHTFPPQNQSQPAFSIFPNQPQMQPQQQTNNNQPIQSNQPYIQKCNPKISQPNNQQIQNQTQIKNQQNHYNQQQCPQLNPQQREIQNDVK